MTALKKYQRLETTGLWREDPLAQRREVLISFGTASLVIASRTETALTHWSLPAIERVNPGVRPALFRPGADSPEELEIEDGDMIDALETIRKSIARKRAHPGRLRLGLLAAFVALLGLIGTFWLPGALVRHAVSVVPESKRNSIGEDLLVHLYRLTGSACQGKLGMQALSELHSRIVGTEFRRSFVVPDGQHKTIVLPGGLLVLNSEIIEDYDTPEVAAGYMLAALSASPARDPLQDMLTHAGPRATLALLTTGQVQQRVLERYAAELLTQAPRDWQDDGMLALFEAKEVSTRAFSYAVDITGEKTLYLIESDPFDGQSPTPLLTDGEWISLQSICTEN
ncbi:MAG: hypothetical protein AAGA12_02595 [Pseudomonadota bacterium]